MKHKIIKLTTPWKHAFFYAHTPQGSGIIGDYKFEIDNDCNECDFWVVWGGFPAGVISEHVKCPAERVIFLTDEVHTGRHFYQQFLDQFAMVISPRADIRHRNLLAYHELNTWHLQKSFDELADMDQILKTKELSVISSNLCFLEGHKLRFAFINKLIGHFKDKMDVYGRGFRPFEDKFEVLAPYKYSIAIENSSVPGYFTEKITECYLAHTMPVYYGCPNIQDYFDHQSLIQIDVHDYKKSIETIEAAIDGNLYENRKNLISAQKHRYLRQYDVFSGLAKLLECNFSGEKKKAYISLKREVYFERLHHLKRLIQIYNNRSFIPEKWKFDIQLRQEKN